MYVNINTQETMNETPPENPMGGDLGWRILDETIPEVPEGFEVLSSKYIQSPTDATKAIIENTLGSITERLERERITELMQHVKWVQLGTQNNVVPDRIGSTFNPANNYQFMLDHGWRDLVDNTMPTPPEGYETLSWTYQQDPNNADRAIIVCEIGSIAEREAREAQIEEQWQESKSDMLKGIENLYVGFLTTEWTNILRTNGLIGEDFTITVENTDSQTNMLYLMQLRQLDTVDLKPTYNYFASEFSRFQSTIEKLGGIMAKVRLHE